MNERLLDLKSTLARHKTTFLEIKAAPLGEDVRKTLLDNYAAMIDSYELMIANEKERMINDGVRS